MSPDCGNDDPPDLLLPLTVLRDEDVLDEVRGGLPAAEQEDRVRGVSLGRHRYQGDHHRRLLGGVVEEDVLVDVPAEGEVPEGGSPRVGEAADGDGCGGGDGEVFDVPVLHAGVDGDDTDVTLVAEADDGDDGEDVQPVVGPGLDGAGNDIIKVKKYCRHSESDPGGWFDRPTAYSTMISITT